MPATPGTSAAKTIDPAIGLASSTTWDPFVPIEAGRTYAEPEAAAEASVETKTGK